METEIPRRRCGVCGRTALGRELPGNMGLYALDRSFTLDSAHTLCISAVVGELRKRFPQLDLRIHPYEIDRSAQQLADAEDNAIDRAREEGRL